MVIKLFFTFIVLVIALTFVAKFSPKKTPLWYDALMGGAVVISFIGMVVTGILSIWL